MSLMAARIWPFMCVCDIGESVDLMCEKRTKQQKSWREIQYVKTMMHQTVCVCVCVCVCACVRARERASERECISHLRACGHDRFQTTVD